MTEQFTPKQEEELNRQAEERDLDTNRLSRLSKGEEQRLDDRDEVRGLPLFSVEQLAILDALAEQRDLSRPRRSRFSLEEQGELDSTAQVLRDEAVEMARTLDFNELQKADLTHRFNVQEINHPGDRFLALLIVVLLVCGGFFGDIVWQQAQTDQTRSAIVTLCQHQTQVNCNNLFK